MSAFPFSVQDIARPQPVLTDHHGSILQIGDAVEDSEDNVVFVVERVYSHTEYFLVKPAYFILRGVSADGSYRHVYASRTMLSQRPSGEEIDRAAFCSGCNNHYAKEHIKKHNCARSSKTHKRAMRGVFWCVPRLLRWKHRALQYYQGSLATLREQGIADHGSFM
jgi:hypothetical protein